MPPRQSHPHLWTSLADTAVPEKPEKDSRYLNNSHSAPNLSLSPKKHTLVSCPAYHGIRMSLGDNLKSLLMLHEFSIIMETGHAEEFGQYLRRCYRKRNPKKKFQKNTKDKRLPKKGRGQTNI